MLNINAGEKSASENLVSVVWPVLVFAVFYWCIDVFADVFIFRDADFFTSLLNPDRGNCVVCK